VATVADLHRLLDGEAIGEDLPLQTIRAGKPRPVTVRPTELPGVSRRAR